MLFEPTSIVELSFPNLQAFSINAASCRDARFKSSAFKAWHTATKATIQMHGKYKDLLAFAETFKQGNDKAIAVTISIYYPIWLFFTSKGTISSKTFDVTNTEKLLVDLLFGDIMQINDKNIVRLVSTKAASKDYRIDISLETCPAGYKKA